MFTKRNALLMGMLFLLLFTAACGGGAATEASRDEPSAPAEEPAIPAPYQPLAPAPTYVSSEAEAPAGAPDASTQNWGAPPAKREPYDTFFEDYGVNPSIDTEDDNLSTFALDVDTGSYTIMRNYLRDGYEVPPDSVRVEEYVNYFDQDYENPPAHQAFNISVDGAPSPVVIIDQRTTYWAPKGPFWHPGYERLPVGRGGVLLTTFDAERIQGEMRAVFDDKDVHGVVVATPEQWHALATVLACQAGKDVYLEKPTSHNIWEGRKIVEAARKYDRIVQTGSQGVSSTLQQQAKEMIRAGRLGKIALVTCWNYHNTGQRVGRQPDSEIPAGYDWDRWLGPAPWRQTRVVLTHTTTRSCDRCTGSRSARC